MSLIWAVAWVLLGAVRAAARDARRHACSSRPCASVFALGETLMQPTIPALVNDLAPDHLRGRYNALSSGAFSLAAIVAPAIAGWLIGHALGSALHRDAGRRAVPRSSGSRSVLERRLPQGANGVPRRSAESRRPVSG